MWVTDVLKTKTTSTMINNGDIYLESKFIIYLTIGITSIYPEQLWPVEHC